MKPHRGKCIRIHLCSDDINASRASLLAQSAVDNKQETIRAKTEELKRKYDALVAEKQVLKDETSRLQK